MVSGITARSCDDHFAGTQDNVRVHLRDGASKGHHGCTTNWLHENSDYWLTRRWSSSSTETWATRLGACLGTSFQSIDNLEFRLELEPHGLNLHYNALKICKLEVDCGQAEAVWNVPQDQGVWTDGQYTPWTRLTGRNYPQLFSWEPAL